MSERFWLKQTARYSGFVWAAILLSCFTAIAQTDPVACYDEYTRAERVQKKALVIVAANYASPEVFEKIPNTKLDGENIIATLEKLGFTVTPSFDEPANAVWNKIIEFTNALKVGDLAVVYFSGHGFQNEGISYFAPVDTPSQLKSDRVSVDAIPILAVIQKVSNKKVGLGFIILDACRDNKSIVQTPNGIPKSTKQGLGPEYNKEQLQSEMLIAYATNYGKTSWIPKDPNENSLYTKYLVMNMANKGKNISDILQDVHVAVIIDCKRRNCNQYPIYEGAGGSFFPSPSEANLKEGKDEWLRVCKTQDAIEVQRFLCRWPVSEYSASARRWLAHSNSKVPPGRILLLTTDGILFGGYRLIRGENLAAPAVASTDASEGQPAIVAVDNMRVFDQPDATAYQTATLPIGETVWILDPKSKEEKSDKGTSIWSKISVKLGRDNQLVGYVKDAVRIDDYVPYEKQYTIKLKPTNRDDLFDGKVLVSQLNGKDLSEFLSLTEAIASQSSGRLNKSVLSQSSILVKLHDYIEGCRTDEAARQSTRSRALQIRDALINSGASIEKLFIEEPTNFRLGDKGTPNNDEVIIFLVK